jgi:hypothetical protein
MKDPDRPTATAAAGDKASGGRPSPSVEWESISIVPRDALDGLGKPRYSKRGVSSRLRNCHSYPYCFLDLDGQAKDVRAVFYGHSAWLKDGIDSVTIAAWSPERLLKVAGRGFMGKATSLYEARAEFAGQACDPQKPEEIVHQALAYFIKKARREQRAYEECCAAAGGRAYAHYPLRDGLGGEREVFLDLLAQHYLKIRMNVKDAIKLKAPDPEKEAFRDIIDEVLKGPVLSLSGAELEIAQEWLATCGSPRPEREAAIARRCDPLSPRFRKACLAAEHAVASRLRSFIEQTRESLPSEERIAEAARMIARGYGERRVAERGRGGRR